MPQCVSTKADGQRCTKNGDPAHDGMCGTHHNQKMRQDPAYALRFMQPPPLIRRDAVAVDDDIELPVVPRVHVVHLLGQGRQPANPALRRYNILRTDIINARDDLQRFRDIGRNNFGNNELFDQVEPTIHQLAELFERIQPLREQENVAVEHEVIAQLQIMRAFVRRANAAVQPALRRRREEALQEMVRNILGGGDAPMVFQRDPNGGINLRAFAIDAQSVHRSSVQEMAQKGIEKILAGPAPAQGTDTLFEITVAFTDPLVRWAAGDYEHTIQELHRDYETSEALGVKYSRVVDHLWLFVKTHVERSELTRRLAEELNEGRGMCSNGKMARLVNVLQGYDDAMAVVIAPQREQFQSKIAVLASRPQAERRDAAMALFAEYNIPAVEQDAWLEPLLEA